MHTGSLLGDAEVVFKNLTAETMCTGGKFTEALLGDV